MNCFKVRLVRNRVELNQCLKIRDIVFIREQKVPPGLEIDEYDTLGGAKHIIAFCNGRPVGTARIRLIKKRAKLERLAVLKRYRSKGLGLEIVRYFIKYSKRRKIKELVLHGQCYAKGFYEKLGFRARGKKFMDAGIEHIEMIMRS